VTRLPTPRFLDRRSPPHLATLVLLTALPAMAMNIFLPSLPSMAAHFGADYRVMQLSVALYLAMNGVLQLVVGPLSDRFGRRPVVLGSIALFLLATLGCLVAPTVEVFLAFRMAQAVIVAGMVLSRAIVRDMVGDAEAASLIGYVTMGMAIVPMASPALGGVLDALFGWQASFALLLAAGLAVGALAWADQGETAMRRTPGSGAMRPQLEELLRARRFWGYALTAAFAAGAFFAYLGGAPFVGSEVYGLDPARLGLYFGAPALGYALGNFVSGRYAARLGLTRMIAIGTLTCSAGLAAALGLELAGLLSAELFFGMTCFVGLGNGMVLPSANAGMMSVRPGLAGSASGLGGAMMLGGGAALSALAGALLAPGSGALPLLAVMLASALAAVVTVRLAR
jgi:DHA1 family bicyclomycin/chloramphenicol resistance-like MFS transporter